MIHPTLQQYSKDYFEMKMNQANKESWRIWALKTPNAPLLPMKRQEVKQGSVMRLFIKSILP